jgi:hypothetical protein
MTIGDAFVDIPTSTSNAVWELAKRSLQDLTIRNLTDGFVVDKPVAFSSVSFISH